MILVLSVSFTTWAAPTGDAALCKQTLHPNSSASQQIKSGAQAQASALVDPYAGKKSPLAPKPLMVRLVHNIWRWYFKKDPRDLANMNTEQDYNFLSDYDYLAEKRQSDRLGVVKSVFSEDLDTRIYYTATAKPDANGKIPVTDPEAHAVYFYFHGSGTNKASGANFSYKMNKLAQMGYSVLSMDLPFHADGSRDRRQMQPEFFYNNLKRMIEHYRIQGKPVYLLGHSFGPEIAAEFVTRHPEVPDVHVLGISPASFNDELVDWFMNKTAHMTALWGDMVTNDDGAAWAGVLSSYHRWKLPKGPTNPDPTLIRPDLRLRFLTGEYEEYAPGRLDQRGLPTKERRDYDICGAIAKLFASVICTMEPGVGHYIFEHKDRDGYDVILREALALDGKNMADEKQMRQDFYTRNQVEDWMELARRFERENAMRAFLTTVYKGKETVQDIFTTRDSLRARRILQDFNRWVVSQREQALAQNLKATQAWAPDFYAANQKEIDAVDLRKPRPSDSLMNKYFGLLDSLSPEDRNRLAVVSANVYTIPEKKEIPEHVLERQRQQQQKNNQQPEAPKKAG